MLHSNMMMLETPDLIKFNLEDCNIIPMREGRNKPCKCEIWVDLVENNFPNDMSWTPVDPKGGKSHLSENVERDILIEMGNDENEPKDGEKMINKNLFDEETPAITSR